MFGFFTPSLPLDTWEKAWTESRMQWLASQLGIDRLLNANVLLPTDPGFPHDYSGTSDEVRQVMDLLGERMLVDTSKLQLEICGDEQMPNTAGHYDDSEGQRVIRLAESQVYDPEAMVATLAHELSHELLLGGGHLTTETFDHEWITDLLPVYLGVGVFGANATIREYNVQDGHQYWHTVTKQGYLRSTMLGYALALFTWIRDDPKPAWAAYLRLDAASSLRSGVRYLQRTGDSLFHLFNIQHSREAFSINELTAELSSKSATWRIAALWELAKRGQEAGPAAELITRQLRDRDRGVRCEAANTLAAIGSAAEVGVPQLCSALQDPDFTVRCCAADALGMLAKLPDTTIPALTDSLADEVASVIVHASTALALFGASAEPAVPDLLCALREACIKCQHDNATVLVWTLDQISSRAESLIAEFFVEAVAEYAEYALELLAECRAPRLDNADSSGESDCEPGCCGSY